MVIWTKVAVADDLQESSLELFHKISGKTTIAEFILWEMDVTFPKLDFFISVLHGILIGTMILLKTERYR